MLAEVATRETFDGLATWQVAFWYFLIFLSTAIFFYGVYRLVRKYRRAGKRVRLDRSDEARGAEGRADRTIVLTHSWIRRRDPIAGLGHLFIFYGFLVLFIGTAILAFQDDFAGPARLRLLEGLVLQGLLRSSWTCSARRSSSESGSWRSTAAC